MNKSLSILLTLDKFKIISVNDLYKAKIGYKFGKPYPVIYKNPKAKEIESAVFTQLSSIDFTEHLEFLKTTKNYILSYNFILKSGITSRDLGNLEKCVTDIFVKYVNEVLGITTFDDSQISEIQLVKSIIPKAKSEYIGMTLGVSTHEVRFDKIPEPDKIHLVNGDSIIKDIKKELKGRKIKLFSEQDGDDKLDKCNTKIHILSAGDEDFLFNFMKAMFEVKECITIGRNFVWVGILDTSALSNKLDELKKTIEYIKSLSGPGRNNIQIEFIQNTKELIDKKIP